MENNTLYSIGHGTRNAEDFLSLLKKFHIDYLIDVRSKPYSRFNPQYNQSTLKKFLEKNNVQYVFMGNELGGWPRDKSCYNKLGMPDYEIIKEKDFFKAGIERLKTAYEKNIQVAIMCSERKPIECHRTMLIGTFLEDQGISLLHIDEKGELKNQDRVMNEITGHTEANLFTAT